MNGFLEATYDKFIFRVKTGCLYTKDEFWAHVDGTLATVGVADFLQKASGDVAFLEMVEPGTEVRQDQESATSKPSRRLSGIISPVTGKVVEVNPEMEASPYPDQPGPLRRWLDLSDRTQLIPEGDKAALIEAKDISN